MAYAIDRVDGRAKLKPRRDPYYKKISRGRYIGFRIMAKGGAGSFTARAGTDKPFEYEALGDFGDLPEKERYDAALKAATEWFTHLELGGAAKAGSVEDACRDYVEHQRIEKSEAAADDASGFYRRLVWGDKDKGIPRDRLASVDLARATKRDFMAFRTRLRKAYPSDTTFNRSLTPVRAALNHARDIGQVATDQSWREALRPIKCEGKRREQYLDAGQRTKLIEHCSEEAKRYFNVLRLLPLRPGDVAKLLVSHFKPEQRTLSVQRGKTERHDIPLSAEAVAHFRECAKNKLPTAWLISRDDGGQWKKEAWRDEIKIAAAGAKLPRATVAYALRHSVITDLMTGGLDIFSVAKLAGTSVVMIEKHYGHLQREHARAALDKLAKL